MLVPKQRDEYHVNLVLELFRKREIQKTSVQYFLLTDDWKDKTDEEIADALGVQKTCVNNAKQELWHKYGLKIQNKKDMNNNPTGKGYKLKKGYKLTEEQRKRRCLAQQRRFQKERVLAYGPTGIPERERKKMTKAQLTRNINLRAGEFYYTDFR